jgi:hypothetical protein
MSLLQMTFDDCIAAGTRISAWHIATHHLDFVSNPNSGGGMIHAFEIMDLHPPFVAGVIDAGLGRPKKSLLDLDAADAYGRGYEYIDAAAVVRSLRRWGDDVDAIDTAALAEDY